MCVCVWGEFSESSPPRPFLRSLGTCFVGDNFWSENALEVFRVFKQIYISWVSVPPNLPTLTCAISTPLVLFCLFVCWEGGEGSGVSEQLFPLTSLPLSPEPNPKCIPVLCGMQIHSVIS